MIENRGIINGEKQMIISFLFNAVLREELSKLVLVKDQRLRRDNKLTHRTIFSFITSINALISIFPPIFCPLRGESVSNRPQKSELFSFNPKNAYKTKKFYY